MSQKILLITAPSGAGKTSITHYLLEKYKQLTFSVSAATRSPRAHEKDGIDYYFLSLEEFQRRIRDNEFAEWEMVYEGKYYGTLKNELQRIWNLGHIPVLDIDVKGAIHVQQQYPGTTLSLFIEPPSISELERRLRSRGTETAETLEARINKAAYEISFKHHFDKIIVNDELGRACAEADALIGAWLEGSPGR